MPKRSHLKRGRSKRRRTLRKRTLRARRQRGGQLPTGYPGTVVSYTPKSDELGDVDAVPRIGSKEDFDADVEASR